MSAKRQWLFVALLVGVWFLPSTPAWGQTITVTTTADETTANGQTSLREAIAWANANGQSDTIQLQAGAHLVLDFCAAGPLVHTATHALTIQGGVGTSLQNVCGGMRTIVDTDGSAGLTIRSLDLVGTSMDDAPYTDGIAVDAEGGGPLLLDRVDVRGFDAGPDGTVVDGGDSGAVASIVDSEVWGNEGTGVSLSFGSLTLERSEVHDNLGRGVSLVDGTPLTVSQSSVSDNTGSGITTTGQGNTVVLVTSSHVDRNGALGLGCSACDAVTITGSTVVGNGTATTTGGGGVRATWDYDSPDDDPRLSITGSTVAYNRSVQQGGGVHVGFIEDSDPTATAGALTISGSNISANLTDSFFESDGGGIYAATGNVTISNGSAITANKAGPPGGATSADGGGIWHRELADLNGTRTLSITDATVSGNEANGSGGGVYAVHGGTVSITGSTLDDNLAGSSSGGAISTAGTATAVTTTKVRGNDADIGGGIAHTSFSGFPVGSLTVVRSTVSGNTSSFGASGGGGVFVNVGGAGAQATLRNSTVTGNTSAGYGGGVMVMQTSRLTLDHATVVDNAGATGANVFVAAGTFRTRRAVVALADGTGANCAFSSAPSVSEGYSWSDDTSCALGPTDVQAPGVDPLLGALAMNGGPTPTRRPQKGSPLAMVPTGSCTLTTDQRGEPRPRGARCEAGAVEVDEAAPK